MFKFKILRPLSTIITRQCSWQISRYWKTLKFTDNTQPGVGDKSLGGLQLSECKHFPFQKSNRLLSYQTQPEQNVREFLKKYELDRFTFNSNVVTQCEFPRLCALRRWGPAKFARIFERGFQSAVIRQKGKQSKVSAKAEKEKKSGVALKQQEGGSNFKLPKPIKSSANSFDDADAEEPASTGDTLRPLACFFTQFNSQRYKYQALKPLQEFERLVQIVGKPDWEKLPRNQRLEDCDFENLRPRQSRSTKQEEERKPRYYISRTYKALRARFHQAVEEEFEEGVTRRGQLEGLKPYEYVVELLELAKAPLSRDEADTILHNVNVNIYDFLDYEQALLRKEREAQAIGSTKPVQKPPKPFLYPSEETLGVYCWVTKLIYPLDDASQKGTLKLLLKNVGKHFDRCTVDHVLGVAEKLRKVSSSSTSETYNRLVTFWVVTKIEEFLGLDPESGYLGSAMVGVPYILTPTSRRSLPLGLARGDFSVHDQQRYFEHWKDLFTEARRYLQEHRERR